MVVPRVFISSTYYDLRHVRNAIKEFIEYVGFQSVLSEEFDVFYTRGKSAQQACLDEVKKCDMYILIIGTRYGMTFPNDSLSITHREYREAVGAKLPIFAFVDKHVYGDYRLFCNNKDNPDIKYCNVQQTEVFRLISEVESRETDNALISFDQISEIIEYLRKWLARMFKEKALQPSVEIEEKVEEKVEEKEERTIDIDEYRSFASNLSIVGIPSIGISDIQKNETLLGLLKDKADSVVDLGSDFRISMGASTVNIGKDIIDLLSSQYRQMKGGN